MNSRMTAFLTFSSKQDGCPVLPVSGPATAPHERPLRLCAARKCAPPMTAPIDRRRVALIWSSFRQYQDAGS